MAPSELADRLVGSDKGITKARIVKFVRHLADQAHYEATLQAIPSPDAVAAIRTYMAELSPNQRGAVSDP